MGNLSGPGLEESALRPAQGTCEWFLKEPMFEEWLAGTSSFSSTCSEIVRLATPQNKPHDSCFVAQERHEEKSILTSRSYRKRTCLTVGARHRRSWKDCSFVFLGRQNTGAGIESAALVTRQYLLLLL